MMEQTVGFNLLSYSHCTLYNLSLNIKYGRLQKDYNL